jgi:hypothetical protein
MFQQKNRGRSIERVSLRRDGAHIRSQYLRIKTGGGLRGTLSEFKACHPVIPRQPCITTTATEFKNSRPRRYVTFDPIKIAKSDNPT